MCVNCPLIAMSIRMKTTPKRMGMLPLWLYRLARLMLVGTQVQSIPSAVGWREEGQEGEQENSEWKVMRSASAMQLLLPIRNMREGCALSVCHLNILPISSILASSEIG